MNRGHLFAAAEAVIAAAGLLRSSVKAAFVRAAVLALLQGVMAAPLAVAQTAPALTGVQPVNVEQTEQIKGAEKAARADKSSQGARSLPIIFTDDAGRQHRLPAPAQRVVTLAPHLTELVYAVGGGSRMIGTLGASKHPAAAQALPSVGDHARVDVERLLLLKPDLVLAWHNGNADRELRALEAVGLRVIRMEAQRLDDVPISIERVARLLGLDAEGAHEAHRLRLSINALRLRYAAATPLRVFYQVWQQPLLTLNASHLVSDVLALCGGRNIFAGLAPLVPPVSSEAVLAANPEVVMAAGDAKGKSWVQASTEPEFAAWQGMDKLAATKRAAFFKINGDLITRAGPRIDQGAQAVCEALQSAR